MLVQPRGRARECHEGGRRWIPRSSRRAGACLLIFPCGWPSQCPGELQGNPSLTPARGFKGTCIFRLLISPFLVVLQRRILIARALAGSDPPVRPRAPVLRVRLQWNNDAPYGQEGARGGVQGRARRNGCSDRNDPSEESKPGSRKDVQNLELHLECFQATDAEEAKRWLAPRHMGPSWFGAGLLRNRSLYGGVSGGSCHAYGGRDNMCAASCIWTGDPALLISHLPSSEEISLERANVLVGGPFSAHRLFATHFVMDVLFVLSF